MVNLELTYMHSLVSLVKIELTYVHSLVSLVKLGLTCVHSLKLLLTLGLTWDHLYFARGGGPVRLLVKLGLTLGALS